MRESATQQISSGIIARYPLIYILGWEEERIEKTLAQVSAKHYFDKRPVVTWTTGKGFYTHEGQVADISDAVKAIEYIAKSDKQTFYLLKDCRPILKTTWYLNVYCVTSTSNTKTEMRLFSFPIQIFSYRTH